MRYRSRCSTNHWITSSRYLKISLTCETVVVLIKSPSVMKTRFLSWRSSRAGVLAVGAVLAITAVSLRVAAQQHVNKRYPAGQNVRIELKNISGTIVVEAWNKNEIRLSATIESKGTNITPRQINESFVVDVMSDNRGRGDVGDINLKLRVPANSIVAERRI